MNVPNYCTLLRIIVLAPMLLLLLAEEFAFALGVFIFASLLDWLDGWIARRLNQTSIIGAMLDHLADKLLICCTLITLVYVQPGFFALLAVLVVVTRDLLMGGMREYWLKTGLQNRSAVNLFGKWKTTIQMLSICTILLVSSLPETNILWLADLCYLLIIVVTLLSLVQYLRPVKIS